MCAAVSSFSMFSPPHIIADNDDVLREILIRLPVNALLRFKLVSKHWLSLITDPRFCLNKSQILCKQISGLFLHRTSFYPDQVYDFIPLDDDDDKTRRTPPFRTLPFVPDHDHHLHSTKLNILRSCNGLLLCRSSFLEQDAGKLNYYIFNPTTRKFTPINPDPLYPPAADDARQSVRAVYLAFDPRKSAKYKVIWIYVSNSKSNSAVVARGFEIGIYSSSSGIWKWCSRHDGSGTAAQPNLETGVYWNGAINWTSNRGNNALYFNVDEERFGTLPMPEVPEVRAAEGRRIRYFGESNDHLHLIETTGPLATRFNVYEMMDKEYSGWVVKYQVDLEEVKMKLAMTWTELNLNNNYNFNNRSSYHSFQLHKFAIIDLVRRKKEEDSFLVFSIPGMAVRYNFTDKSVNKVHDFDPNHLLGGPPMIGCYYSFGFIYSLMPLT